MSTAFMNTEKYPNDNGDTEKGHEGNYLALKNTEAYLAYMRGEITLEDYQLVMEGIMKQGEWLQSLDNINWNKEG